MIKLIQFIKIINFNRDSLLLKILFLNISLLFCFFSVVYANSEKLNNEINLIYQNLQKANNLNTNLKIIISGETNKAIYSNDGKVLIVSKKLIDDLSKISNGMALFLAREIAYAENLKLGLCDTQLEFFSDKAAFVIAKNGGYKVGNETFKQMLQLIDDDSNDKIRRLKLLVSNHITISDLQQISSKRLKRGATLNKTINLEKIKEFDTWKPIISNVILSVVSTTAIYYGVNVANNLLNGLSIDESLKKAVRSTFSSEFLVGSLGGSLIGGALGSIAGSLIPIPGCGPIISNFISTLPVILGSNLGSELGTSTILDYKKNKNLSLKRIIENVDISHVIGHSVGMSLGISLGTAMIPIPVVGGFIGGVVGGFIGSNVAKFVSNSISKDRKLLDDKELNNNQNIKPITSNYSLNYKNDSIEIYLNLKNKVQLYYKNYIILLETEPNNSEKLQKALNEYLNAKKELEQLGFLNEF